MTTKHQVTSLLIKGRARIEEAWGQGEPPGQPIKNDQCCAGNAVEGFAPSLIMHEAIKRLIRAISNYQDVYNVATLIQWMAQSSVCPINPDEAKRLLEMLHPSHGTKRR